MRFAPGADLRSTWLHHLTIPLRVAVEAGSASPDDRVVARRVGVLRARLRKNPAGERCLAVRPPGPGRRCLRGAGEPAAPSPHRDGPREEPPGWGAGSERLYETGDRSRNSRWSRSCSGVELTAAPPRRSRSTTSCQRALYVTDVTVVSGTPGFLRVDPDLSSRIRSIRTEPRGAGFRHGLPASATSYPPNGSWEASRGRLSLSTRSRPRTRPHPRLFRGRQPGLCRRRAPSRAVTPRLHGVPCRRRRSLRGAAARFAVGSHDVFARTRRQRGEASRGTLPTPFRGTGASNRSSSGSRGKSPPSTRKMGGKRESAVLGIGRCRQCVPAGVGVASLPASVLRSAAQLCPQGPRCWFHRTVPGGRWHEVAHW